MSPSASGGVLSERGEGLWDEAGGAAATSPDPVARPLSSQRSPLESAPERHISRDRGRSRVMAANLNSMAPPKSYDSRYTNDGGSVITTNVDQVVNALLNWGRANSVWYLLFGLACCAIELMQTGGPRSDFDRFGALPRPSPRSSDLFIIAGTLTYKMAL